MGKCEICKKDNSKAFLFLPSNVWVFLCSSCSYKRLDYPDYPILEWIEKEKGILNENG